METYKRESWRYQIRHRASENTFRSNQHDKGNFDLRNKITLKRIQPVNILKYISGQYNNGTFKAENYDKK
jgi:hypothetical protein